MSSRQPTKYLTLHKKRVSAHSIRHTSAVHLLRARVDINTIRAWLGHDSGAFFMGPVDIDCSIGFGPFFSFAPRLISK
ncbi:MAG: tyrosine-type recombinase/integrase [Syntrophorhabdales bacterium]